MVHLYLDFLYLVLYRLASTFMSKLLPTYLHAGLILRSLRIHDLTIQDAIANDIYRDAGFLSRGNLVNNYSQSMVYTVCVVIMVLTS